MTEADPNDSPYIDHWTDEKWRERWEFHRREQYESFKELRMSAQRAHLEYGKWIVASLLAIHGGSLYALSSLRHDMPAGFDASGLVTAGILFVTGIGFVMVTALMGWLNFQCAEVAYHRFANPAMVYRTDVKFPEQRRDPVTATLYGAAAAGIISQMCFIMGAAEIFKTLRLAAEFARNAA